MEVLADWPRGLLQPALVLVLWTLVMWGWMMATRIPALLASGFDVWRHVGGNAADAARMVPERVQWKADNHNHLMEQPTLFYALAAILALAPPSPAHASAAVTLAWAYAGLRIVHSLVQALSNRILYRFALHLVSTLALIGLALAGVPGLMEWTF